MDASKRDDVGLVNIFIRVSSSTYSEFRAFAEAKGLPIRLVVASAVSLLIECDRNPGFTEGAVLRYTAHLKNRGVNLRGVMLQVREDDADKLTTLSKLSGVKKQILYGVALFCFLETRGSGVRKIP